MDNKSISHTRCKCQYHMVFIPKYRKKTLYGTEREDVREIIKTLCKYKDVEIIAGAVCEDHVHLSVAIPPKLSISSFMGYLKGKSKQKNQEKKILAVPLYSGPVKVLATPPFGASSNIALWRGKIKPPVELVVGDLL